MSTEDAVTKSTFSSYDGADAPNEEDAIRTSKITSRRRTTIAKAAERWTLVVLLLALIMLFAILPGSSQAFLSLANVRNFLADEAVITITALASLVPLISGDFDISVGSVVGLVAFMAPYFVATFGFGMWAAIFAALACGLAVGAVNGFLIAYVGANSLIITLGMQTLLGGILLLFSGGIVLTTIPVALSNLGGDLLFGFPYVVWFTALVAFLVGFAMRYSLFGRKITFLGSSVAAARLVGLRTKRLLFSSYMIAAGLASIGGLVLLIRSGVGDPTAGPQYTLEAIASCFLGATTITPGRFNVMGTLVGVLVVGVAVNGLTLLGVLSWVEPVFSGAVVMVAVTISVTLRRKAEGS